MRAYSFARCFFESFFRLSGARRRRDWLARCVVIIRLLQKFFLYKILPANSYFCKRDPFFSLPPSLPFPLLSIFLLQNLPFQKSLLRKRISGKMGFTKITFEIFDTVRHESIKGMMLTECALKNVSAAGRKVIRRI